MSIPLADGSFAGDGSQIGMFPVLADTILEKPSILLRTSTNPRMDLVLLLVKDSASASIPAATAPPGMSAAQFALVQRMLAARNRGAQAAAGGAVAPEPKRGPQIHLVLWRMGDDSSIIWSVSLEFDKVMDKAGVTQQEHEDVVLHDVAWSPKGDRIGVLASVRRSPVASTSTSGGRASTFLRTYSVQDGHLLSTVRVGPHSDIPPNVVYLDSPMTMQWQDIESGTKTSFTEAATDASSETLLSKLPCLPALPAADTFASAGGGGNLMPHQLRMMQMSGQKPPPSFQFPSQLALQGRGALASIPFLAKGNADLGLLEGGDASLSLDEDAVLPLFPDSVVLVSHLRSGNIDIVLDGQTKIEALRLPQLTGQDGPQAQQHLGPSQALLIFRDLTRLTVISATMNAAVSNIHLRLPLPPTTRYAPSSVRERILSVSRASHLLRFYLGYALDTASALQQVYSTDFDKKVTSEWSKNIDDLGVNFGGDMKYELISVLLTGRAGPAAEQFLLGNLTEGVLSRLEKDAHAALYGLKRLIWESLRPSLERCIIALSGLLGVTRFHGMQEESKGLENVLKVLQATLDAALTLAEEVDTEALISQEFYRWCRTERERQERIKQDQDEPRLPITYDVHTVAGYIERGFENEALDKMLGSRAESEKDVAQFVQSEQKASLKEMLEKAGKFLAITASANTKGRQGEEEGETVKSGKTGLLPIIPTLTRAIEMLGGQLPKLLDGGLQNCEVLISTSHSIKGEWKLTQEPAPALSISSSTITDIADATSRVLATTFVSGETLLSAYILRPFPSSPVASPSSVVVVRTGYLEPTIVHFAAATEQPMALLDIGFYGDTEVLVLASLLSTDTSVLLAFNIAQLPFGSEAMVEVVPSRATEFEKDFKAAKMAVNMNKQTVAVLEHEGKRVVYLDNSTAGVDRMAMDEEV
ncbi:uncharacterized protein MEPE_05611 [Melanopsichium pennsylvanicum]|uniref:Anaphase-promoting complex subunit 4 n=2 Tax=Melanopsichium pennsylvanicum TaxID=63383 RepID=A0AAJ4XR90_9BASI|nr:hypothetical protein BN887_01008 [Melanopsichium pennsylvanicum 4]SNX86902.1 uncharacterized protein MEPE_05611 [Melanopsichium pennsylvanicum]